MYDWLKNKYVVLTGASSGIGRELTKLLILRYGAKVIGIGRNEEKMYSLKTELSDRADDFSYQLFDVSNEQAWTSFATHLHEQKISPILLVNNAGVFPPLGQALETPSPLVENTLNINFLATMYAVNAISPLLSTNEKHKPSIVNICSSAALCPVVGSAAYSASKSALKGYTEALQLELKGKIHVGIMYPGTTDTDIFRDDKNVQASAMKRIASSPQKMAKKIARKIYRRKKRAVLGWDAKCMNLLAKFMPVKGPALICRIMKASKSKAFENVFNDKE